MFNRIEHSTWASGFELLGMTSKNLQRLFPSDQSMVAIIDDRSDVWADVPNLVKVNPCTLSLFLNILGCIQPT